MVWLNRLFSNDFTSWENLFSVSFLCYKAISLNYFLLVGNFLQSCLLWNTTLKLTRCTRKKNKKYNKLQLMKIKTHFHWKNICWFLCFIQHINRFWACQGFSKIRTTAIFLFFAWVIEWSLFLVWPVMAFKSLFRVSMTLRQARV